jgi:hypothetical protein
MEYNAQKASINRIKAKTRGGMGQKPSHRGSVFII